MSATLGGLIKDYRRQKDISQLEVATYMGWKEPSRLSRIEQGRVGKPSRETLEKLMNALQLNEEERNSILFVGGYQPNQKEVDEARKKMKDPVDNWPFPAGCRDYTWRIIYSNKKLNDLYQIPVVFQKKMEIEMPTIPELTLDPHFILNQNINEDRKQFLLRMLAHFKHDLHGYTKEKWYQDLIQRLMRNEIFRGLWPEIDTSKIGQTDLGNFGLKDAPSNKGTLNFYFFIVPLFKDPRFQIEFYIPSDEKTMKYFS